MEASNGDVILEDDGRSTAFGTVAWQDCRRMIYVPRSAQKGFAVGFWPIPEAFWPDINAPSLVMLVLHLFFNLYSNLNLFDTSLQGLLIQS